MKIVVQKVISADVTVNKKQVGKIDKGLMLLVAFTKGDNIDTINYMANKVLNLRIFDDENGIMNLSVLDVNGSILSISQFTLYGDCKKGNRPSYIKALGGEEASILYDKFNETLRKNIHVETGIFGEDMKVSLINDGPTTIIIEKEND